jgi:hypothetical protein
MLWTVAEDDKNDVFVFNAGRNSSCARLGLRPFLNIRNVSLVCPCVFAAAVVLVVFLTYTNTGLAGKNYTAITWEKSFGEITKHPGDICESIRANEFIARPINAVSSWSYICASCFAFLLFAFDVDARIRIAPTQADVVRNITKSPKALVLLVRQPIWTFLFGIYFLFVGASSFWYYSSISYKAFKVNTWSYWVVDVHFLAYAWSRVLLEGMPTGHRDSEGCCGFKGIACTMTVEDRAGLEFTVSFMAIVFTVFLNILLYLVVEYVDEIVGELVFFVIFWIFVLGIYVHWIRQRRDVDVFFAPLGWALIAGGCAYLCKYSDRVNCQPTSSAQANAAWQFGSALAWILALLFFRGDRPAKKNLVVTQGDEELDPLVVVGGNNGPRNNSNNNRKSGAAVSRPNSAVSSSATRMDGGNTIPTTPTITVNGGDGGQRRVSSGSSPSRVGIPPTSPNSGMMMMTPTSSSTTVPGTTASSGGGPKRASVVEVDLEISSGTVQVVDRTKDKNSSAPLPPSNPPMKDGPYAMNSMSTVATTSSGGASGGNIKGGRNSATMAGNTNTPIKQSLMKNNNNIKSTPSPVVVNVVNTKQPIIPVVTTTTTTTTTTSSSSTNNNVPVVAVDITSTADDSAPRDRVPSLEDHIQAFLAKKRDSNASIKSGISATSSSAAAAPTSSATKQPVTTTTTSQPISSTGGGGGGDRRGTLESIGGGGPKPGQSRRRVSSVDSLKGLSADQTAALRVLTHEHASQRTLENERTATGVALDVRKVNLRSPEEAREAALSVSLAFNNNDMEDNEEQQPLPTTNIGRPTSPTGSVSSTMSAQERLAVLKAERARVAELAARQLT